MNAQRHPSQAYRLRFEPLVEQERAVCIPCDADGHVDLDALSEAARNAYFHARVLRGHLFSVRVVPLDSN